MLVTLFTLAALFLAPYQFYRAECITVSGFFSRGSPSLVVTINVRSILVSVKILNLHYWAADRGFTICSLCNLCCDVIQRRSQLKHKKRSLEYFGGLSRYILKVNAFWRNSTEHIWIILGGCVWSWSLESSSTLHCYRLIGQIEKIDNFWKDLGLHDQIVQMLHSKLEVSQTNSVCILNGRCMGMLAVQTGRR